MYRLELTEEQMRHLQKVVAGTLAEDMRIVRSRAFAAYGPAESARLHDDVRLGAALLGMMPRLTKERAA